MAAGILVGRWIRGLLGYQPYHKKWTTDWDLACENMRTSMLQKRFADEVKADHALRATWEQPNQARSW